nr:NADH dehydrogenase subunit 6 [Linognathus vituli]
MILILLFLITPASSEVLMIILLALMVTVLGLEMMLSSTSSMIVLIFLLGFLGGMVIMLSFSIKMCWVSQSLTGSYSYILWGFMVFVISAPWPVKGLNSPVTESLTFYFNSIENGAINSMITLYSYSFMMLFLLLMLSVVEALFSFRPTKVISFYSL